VLHSGVHRGCCFKLAQLHSLLLDLPVLTPVILKVSALQLCQDLFEPLHDGCESSAAGLLMSVVRVSPRCR
jgi:hypothetical protein